MKFPQAPVFRSTQVRDSRNHVGAEPLLWVSRRRSPESSPGREIEQVDRKSRGSDIDGESVDRHGAIGSDVEDVSPCFDHTHRSGALRARQPSEHRDADPRLAGMRPRDTFCERAPVVTRAARQVDNAQLHRRIERSLRNFRVARSLAIEFAGRCANLDSHRPDSPVRASKPPSIDDRLGLEEREIARCGIRGVLHEANPALSARTLAAARASDWHPVLPENLKDRRSGRGAERDVLWNKQDLALRSAPIPPRSLPHSEPPSVRLRLRRRAMIPDVVHTALLTVEERPAAQIASEIPASVGSRIAPAKPASINIPRSVLFRSRRFGSPDDTLLTAASGLTESSSRTRRTTSSTSRPCSG